MTSELLRIAFQEAFISGPPYRRIIYSMFHLARALIYAKKYREKSHYCLVVALEHLYVEKGVLEKGFLESLVIGKEMRESADYRSSFSKEGAENLIRAAEDFRDSVGKLLKKKMVSGIRK